ncbi:glycoside hydrolase family 1 protein [Flindersiella endophytica]
MVDEAFPEGFLWGTSTAAHQVEGNNVNSDLWAFEHAPDSVFAEPSGDACDHYRLYRDDIRLLAELGFNAYRFSIEWARVEPEDGFFSRAALRHYADVLDACAEFGLTPVVTLHHFTNPRWVSRLGGWSNSGLPERFAAYVSAVMSELGPRIPYACTINEANIAVILRQVGAPSDGPSMFMNSGSPEALEVIRQAHVAARAAVRKASPSTSVGLTLALQDYQPAAGGEARAAEMWRETFEDFLPAMAEDDFFAVQNYSRVLVGPDGMLPAPEGAELTQMGYEFYPEALANVIRKVAPVGKPILVTENGVAATDDARRVEFVDRALAGVRSCLADGIDVRSYLYWSAFDNFEWVFGYRPTFGLIEVDRRTFERRVKPSARHLGALARASSGR